MTVSTEQLVDEALNVVFRSDRVGDWSWATAEILSCRRQLSGLNLPDEKLKQLEGLDASERTEKLAAAADSNADLWPGMEVHQFVWHLLNNA